MPTNAEKLVSKKYKLTKEIMESCLTGKKTKPLKWFKAGKKINVKNRMQSRYSYTLEYDAGTNLRKGGLDIDGILIKYPDFKPKYSPQQMLRMGIMGGVYMNDMIFEFPREWYLTGSGNFNSKKFSPGGKDPNCNYFKIKASQSLAEWKRKGWIPAAPGDKDNRGWILWYSRYWLGRRQPSVDAVQIKRWKAFARHYGQYKKHTKGKGKNKHPRRRQSLLHWSYPSLD
jgi:hypothetical protein